MYLSKCIYDALPSKEKKWFKNHSTKDLLDRILGMEVEEVFHHRVCNNKRYFSHSVKANIGGVDFYFLLGDGNSISTDNGMVTDTVPSDLCKPLVVNVREFKQEKETYENKLLKTRSAKTKSEIKNTIKNINDYIDNLIEEIYLYADLV